MKLKNSKYNLLHLSNTAGKFGGGISEVVHSIINYQILNIKNIQLWFHGNNADFEYVKSKNLISKSKIHLIPKYIGLKVIIKLIKFHLNDDLKIIHQHGTFMPLSILSIFLNKGTKFIVNPHGLLEPEKFKRSPIKKRIALKLYEKANIKRSHCIVACSGKEALSLKKMFPKKPISIIPNGVHEEMINEKINDIEIFNYKKKYSIPIDKKVLLFLSRIHPWKGLILLINTIVKIQNEFRKNNWIFLIVGSNEQNHLNDINSIINKNKINDIVYVIGPQYARNKIITYELSNCYILPSKGENFGITVIEALSRSKPVITTTKTPWSDLIKFNCGWWIERNSFEFERILLELLVSNNDQLKKMGENGKKLVLKKYTWSKVTLQFEKLYSWVCNNNDNRHKKDLNII